MQRMCSLAAKSNVQLEYLQCFKTLLKPVSRKQTKLLGSSDILRVNTTIADLLKQYLRNIPDCVGRYRRLQVNNEVYHADIYKRPTRYNNTAISFTVPSSNKEMFGIISCFLSVSQDIFVVVKPLVASRFHFINEPKIKHIHVCIATPGSPILIPVSAIHSKVVYMCFPDTSEIVFIAQFPNTIESD